MDFSDDYDDVYEEENRKLKEYAKELLDVIEGKDSIIRDRESKLAGLKREYEVMYEVYEKIKKSNDLCIKDLRTLKKEYYNLLENKVGYNYAALKEQNERLEMENKQLSKGVDEEYEERIKDLKDELQEARDEIFRLEYGETPTTDLKEQLEKAQEIFRNADDEYNATRALGNPEITKAAKKNRTKAMTAVTRLRNKLAKRNTMEEMVLNPREKRFRVEDQVCDYCQTNIAKSQCSNCLQVAYCSVECQSRDWTIGDHAKECKDWIQILSSFETCNPRE